MEKTGKTWHPRQKSKQNPHQHFPQAQNPQKINNLMQCKQVPISQHKIQQQLFIYNFRYETNYPIFKIYHVNCNTSYKQTQNKQQIIIAKIVYELPQQTLKQLEHPQCIENCLYILKTVLMACEKICQILGYFLVGEEMIGVGSDGECKVWVNSGLETNQVERVCGSQEEMVESLKIIFIGLVTKGEVQNSFIQQIISKQHNIISLIKQIWSFSYEHSILIPPFLQKQAKIHKKTKSHLPSPVTPRRQSPVPLLRPSVNEKNLALQMSLAMSKKKNIEKTCRQSKQRRNSRSLNRRLSYQVGSKQKINKQNKQNSNICFHNTSSSMVNSRNLNKNYSNYYVTQNMNTNHNINTNIDINTKVNMETNININTDRDRDRDRTQKSIQRNYSNIFINVKSHFSKANMQKDNKYYCHNYSNSLSRWSQVEGHGLAQIDNNCILQEPAKKVNFREGLNNVKMNKSSYTENEPSFNSNYSNKRGNSRSEFITISTSRENIRRQSSKQNLTKSSSRHLVSIPIEPSTKPHLESPFPNQNLAIRQLQQSPTSTSTQSNPSSVSSLIQTDSIFSTDRTTQNKNKMKNMIKQKIKINKEKKKVVKLQAIQTVKSIGQFTQSQKRILEQSGNNYEEGRNCNLQMLQNMCKKIGNSYFHIDVPHESEQEEEEEELEKKELKQKQKKQKNKAHPHHAQSNSAHPNMLKPQQRNNVKQQQQA